MQAAKQRLLIAEDDALSQMLTRLMLENAGYHVDVVSDGHAVLEALTSIPYGVVIMDCSMPGMDGFATTRAIRTETSGVCDPQVPIIALTALAMRGDRKKCLAAGMTDYLSKPVEEARLIGAVERCLRIGKEPLTSVEPINLEDSHLPNDMMKKPTAQEDWTAGVLDRVLHLFIEEIPDNIAALKAASDAGEYNALRDISHKIHGTATVIKFQLLSDLAQHLNKTLRSSNYELAADNTAKLIQELERLSKALS